MKHKVTDCSVFLPNVYFPSKSSPPNVYRMLTYGYDDDEAGADDDHDNAATDDDMYTVIALAQLC